jgi:predicted RNase H-like HicB family nuclease
MKQSFTVLIEQDESGSYVATVPALKSCYTQADTIPELMEKIQEAIKLCLEVEKEIPLYTSKFVGMQQVEVAV